MSGKGIAHHEKARTLTDDDNFRIRAMRPGEIALAADWAAAEGWNPGDGDAALRHRRSAGFLIGELDGAPAATISCVNYDDRFSFLGYITRPELRGRGHGLRIWNAAVAHAASAPSARRRCGAAGQLQEVGLRAGYSNIRYGGTVATSAAPPPEFVPLADVAFAAIAADDATAFGAARGLPARLDRGARTYGPRARSRRPARRLG